MFGSYIATWNFSYFNANLNESHELIKFLNIKLYILHKKYNAWLKVYYTSDIFRSGGLYHSMCIFGLNIHILFDATQRTMYVLIEHEILQWYL